MKIGIIGTGVYGMSMAIQLAKNNDSVYMWTESYDRELEFKEKHSITGILDGMIIPSNIYVSNSYSEVLDGCDVIFIMSVAKFVGKICDDIKDLIKPNAHICIASKGIENESCAFLSDIVMNGLNTSNVAVISGPTFAIDMANNEPVALAIASKNNDTVDIIKKVLCNDTVKLRETEDIIGVQICGSIKNVIAMAAGMLNGMGYQESTRAFLITEALHDIKSLISAVGGDSKTILSYAGVGDLLLTSTSVKSRNYSFGSLIGSGASKEEIDSYLKENTVEGYYTLMSIYKLINDQNIDMPIIDLIYDIITNHRAPHLLSEFLINKK